jgi:hypothetical protein
MTKKNNQLQGNSNTRLTSSKPTDNEGTAAWANEKDKMKPSDVSIPSMENVIEAKDWVDNGSKL